MGELLSDALGALAPMGGAVNKAALSRELGGCDHLIGERVRRRGWPLALAIQLPLGTHIAQRFRLIGRQLVFIGYKRRLR